MRTCAPCVLCGWGVVVKGPGKQSTSCSGALAFATDHARLGWRFRSLYAFSKKAAAVAGRT